MEQLVESPRPQCPHIFRSRIRWRRCLCATAGMACVVGALCGVNTMAEDQSDPVLKLLLQKGVISEEEVQKAQVQLDAMRSNAFVNTIPPTESKWKISNAIKSIELFGDLRLRYERREATAPDDSSIDLDRFWYAVRVGLRGEVFDDWYYGFRLDTGANPRSAWVTMGTSASSTGYQGPFGKSNSGISVGEVYLGWKPDDWVDLSVGKMGNPLYTTRMVWDQDITPEGAAKKFKYTVGRADFFATFGQFIYQDPQPNQASRGFFDIGYTNSNPAWML